MEKVSSFEHLGIVIACLFDIEIRPDGKVHTHWGIYSHEELGQLIFKLANQL